MMVDTILTAILIGLVVMGVLHFLGSTEGASIVNLLISAMVLGLVIMAIMYFLRTL